MYLAKTISLVLLLTASFTAFAAPQKAIKPCSSKEACLNDPNCYCWCSQSCGWRKKLPEDKPVYIENDPYGKYCYCKQWDYDNYKANCIEGKNVKQTQKDKKK